MKYIRYHLVWAFIFGSASLYAQQISYADNTAKEEQEIPLVSDIFKISTVAFLDETFELGYERFNKNYTGSINVGLGIQSSNSNQNEKFGLKYDLQYRAYPTGIGEHYSKTGNLHRRGIYGGVFMRGEIVNKTYEFYHFDTSQNFGTDRINDQEITVYNPGVLIGIQRTFFDILYLDVFLGGGMRFVTVKNSDLLYNDSNHYRDIYDDDYEGVIPRFGLNIGMGF